jgi:hypothetical protein
MKCWRRGLTLTVLNKQSLEYLFNETYDTETKSDDSDRLASDLMALDQDHLVVITSFDSWEGAVTGKLVEALHSVGGREINLAIAPTHLRCRGHPFALLGSPGIGYGYGIQEVLEFDDPRTAAEVKICFMNLSEGPTLMTKGNLSGSLDCSLHVV